MIDREYAVWVEDMAWGIPCRVRTHVVCELMSCANSRGEVVMSDGLAPRWGAPVDSTLAWVDRA